MSRLPFVFPLQRFTVQEDSMLPTLRHGDEVLVFRLYKGIPGDIVVALIHSRFYVKRVAHIEKNNYYLIGDNIKKSNDSRHFGPVPKEYIVGKVFYIYRS